MQITIVTIGSRGDVQPYVALGAGLSSAGHCVRVATHARFEALVRCHGLGYHPLEGDPRTVLASQEGRRWLGAATPWTFARRLDRLIGPLLATALADCRAACYGSDLVIHSLLAWLVASHVAERDGIALLAAYLQPATPTREFPALSFRPRPGFGGVGNRLSHLVGESAFWRMMRGSVNAARESALGLDPLPRRAPFGPARRRGVPVLYGYSEAVALKPADWSGENHITGYWFLDGTPGWTPPRDLLAFLGSGPPPIYVGFGSVTEPVAAGLWDIVLDALTALGARAIVSGGWATPDGVSMGRDVLGLGEAPHEWLFPRVAAVVHHAGAGTTSAGLRAGIPTVTVPFFGDQHFWAWRVHACGAGPPPVQRRRLNADRLAGAIGEALSSPAVSHGARVVASALRSEDGVAKAVELIEGLWRDGRLEPPLGPRVGRSRTERKTQ